MFEKLDNLIFRRWKWIVYLLGIILILYYEKFNIELVIKIIKQILIVSFIWIFLIFIPRNYLMDYIIKINKFLWNIFPFIFKIRIELINIPRFMRIILSIFFYYFDRILRKFLFIETRKKNFFLFIRLLLYYNILILFTFPFHLIREFYELILDVIDSRVSILQYLLLRIHYLILSILFILLLNISRIDLVILIWILDRLFDIYYYWILTFIDLKKDKWNNFNENCCNLAMSFMDASADYKDITNYISILENKRFNIILLFKGTEMNWNFRFKFVIFFKEIFRNFWTYKYFRFINYLDWAYEYYFVDNDGQFLIRLLVKLSGARESEDYKDSISHYEGLENWLSSEFNREYNEKLYDLMFNFLKNLENNLEIIDEFFILYDKYGKFYLHKKIMENNKEIKEFLNKLEKLVG